MNKCKIKVLVLDVDGTLTDGKIYMGNSGEIMKAFDIKDGCAIHDILPRVPVDWEKYNEINMEQQISGIIPVIMTARESQIVENRCKELKIQFYYQSCRDKATKLRELAQLLECKPNQDGVYEEIAYMGDDLIDIPIMNICGIKACPNDAAKEVVQIADFVSKKDGGDGAVREFVEWLVAER